MVGVLEAPAVDLLVRKEVLEGQKVRLDHLVDIKPGRLSVGRLQAVDMSEVAAMETGVIPTREGHLIGKR